MNGVLRVGQTLSAGRGSMRDDNGMPDSWPVGFYGSPGRFPDTYTYTFQWVRVDADGTSNPLNIGTNSHLYHMVSADMGKRIRVRVSFTDAEGFSESLVSHPSGTVAGRLGGDGHTALDTSLHVENFSSGLKGCSTSIILDFRCDILLWTDTFRLNGRTYRISDIYAHPSGNLTFGVYSSGPSLDVSTGLVLEIDGVSFPFSDSHRRDNHTRVWYGTALGGILVPEKRTRIRICDVVCPEADRSMLSVFDSSASENSGAIDFRVRLHPASSRTVTVDYETTNDKRAKAPHDFVATRGTLIFKPDETEKSISVPIVHDTKKEGGEELTLRLRNANGAAIFNSTAIGSIWEPEEERPTRLRGAFVDAPTEHDGQNAFTLELAFSAEPVDLNLRVLRYLMFTVTNGVILDARPLRPTSNRRFLLTVRPWSGAAVSLTLVDPLPACGATGAVCTSDGHSLSGTIAATVPGLPGLAAADIEAEEGVDAALAFTVSLSRATSRTVTVNYVTANGTATAGSDYTRVNGSLTFNAGETAKTVSVPIIDDTVEDDGETFTLYLFGANGAVVLDTIATGTIRNMEEGESGSLTASFVNAPAVHDGESMFKLRILFSEALKAGGSGRKLAQALSIAGASRGEVRRVNLRHDLYEFPLHPSGTDAVTVTLGPTPSDCSARDAVCTEAGEALSSSIVARIEGQVALEVADSEASIGADATLDFTVSLSRAASGEVTVDYATTDGTATAGADYTTTSDTLTFSAGETEKTVSVPIIDDTVEDDGETFTLTLSNASGAVMLDATATGTIRNAEAGDPGGLTASFVDAPADHDGESTFKLRVLFSEALKAGGAGRKLARALAIAGASRGEVRRVNLRHDLYEFPLHPSGTDAVTVTLGPSPSDCSAQDAVCTETGEALSSSVMARIEGPVALEVADSEASEGAGATLDFTVSLSRAASGQVTVDYATTDGTATAGADYTTTHDALTFSAGETEKTVSVPIIGDTVEDDGETFTLTLSSASGAVLLDATATGTIRNTEAEEAASLTAAIVDVPAGHDGENTFTLELAFSEEPAGLDPQTVRDSLFAVTGGTLEDASRIEQGSNLRYRLTVEPSSDLAVSLTLATPLPACDESGAACTSDGRPLSGMESTTIPGPGSLTASFEDVPTGHDGESAFNLELAFSVEPAGLSHRTVRKHLFTVTGGTITRARRIVRGSNLRYRLTVEPSSDLAISLTLATPLPACDESHAVCTSDGRPLLGTVAATVPGSTALTVTDARVNEASGAPLGFEVSLSQAELVTVTVGYATADGTATAGADYTDTSGTLTFEAGETSKTVTVPVLEDSHDEGSETLTLTLSDPSGAQIEDATATGTIQNSDPMPLAWLARFGRTVADQVIDAVRSRLTSPRSAGSVVSLAGQPLGGGEVPTEALEGHEAESWLDAFGGWLHGASEKERTGLVSRDVTGRELLAGSSFALTRGSAEGGFGAVWGRGAVSRLDGREGDLALDGEVLSAMLGVDFTRGRGTAGLAVVHSRGEGGYRSPAGHGNVESTLTGLYPYGLYRASERFSVWGVAGYGSGTLTLSPEGEAPYETDMNLAMTAVGTRNVLVEAPSEGGLEISLKSDALAVRTTSEEVIESSRRLEAAEGDVTRLRLGLEGTWRGLETGGGGRLEPSFEVGVRRDGGDAETGFGADVGAGLAWTDPSREISAEVRARGLLTHEESGFRERGLAGSLTFDPNPSSDRGVSLAISQTLGAPASGGMETLLEPETMQAFGAPGASDDEPDRRRFDAKAGYGFALFDGGWTGTPEVGLGWSESDREMVLGWRMSEVRSTGLVFGLDVEGARREPFAGDAGPEHRIGLGFGWRLDGVRDTTFEVRFEGSRTEAAHEDGKHHVGVRMTARW